MDKAGLPVVLLELLKKKKKKVGTWEFLRKKSWEIPGSIKQNCPTNRGIDKKKGLQAWLLQSRKILADL
jgi:hypothetical protein